MQYGKTRNLTEGSGAPYLVGLRFCEPNWHRIFSKPSHKSHFEAYNDKTVQFQLFTSKTNEIWLHHGFGVQKSIKQRV
jgi:hypothetical protein